MKGLMMIILLQGDKLTEHAELVDSMFRLRKAVFSDRLGWDVNIRDGFEIDEFDAASPAYLISVDDYGKLKGSLRLLPTTGPNMLESVFYELLDGESPIKSPLIWESTRFCVTPDAASERSENRLNRTTGELLAGIVEVGMKAGLVSVVSVYDAIMKRVLERAGCPAEIIGSPKRIGKVTAYAGLFAIDEAMLGRIQAASGISGSVLQSNLFSKPNTHTQSLSEPLAA
jgi:acyl homoserine lactone synthase